MKKRTKKLIENKNGITLIALVITIIVLLILASVTIQTLTGDNGLLNKALDAKQTSKEAEIRERIQLAVTAAKTNKLGELNKESIEEELTKEFGENNYELVIVGQGYIIIVDNIQYKIEENGTVQTGNQPNESNIENAGDLSKGGQYDGTTEETAYRITCIEDLVEWSNNYNNYKFKYIVLENTVDFNSLASYKDYKAKTTDINGNGKIEELITELTTEKGFIPIEDFIGVFDGKNNEIRNLYIQKRDYAALIKGSGGEIKKLGVIVKLHSNLISAGIASKTSGKFYDCYVNGLIISEQESGGIAGQAYGRVSIYGCYNLAEIKSYGEEVTSDWIHADAAGIIATARNATIINCFNLGNITAKKRAAGICSTDANNLRVINCYNKGNVKSEGGNARWYFIRFGMGIIFIKFM